MDEYRTGFPAFVEAVFYFLLLALSAYVYRIVYELYRNERVLSYIKEVPGSPVIRNLLLLLDRDNLLDNFLKISLKYGSLVRVKIFSGLGAVLVTDLKFLEFLLGTTQIISKSVSYVFFEKWLGDGLLISTGEKWNQRRKILTPAFHFEILQHYVQCFHSSTEILIEKLRRHAKTGDTFDVLPYITLCTLDIICESAMGTKINAQENETSEYVTAVKEMCRIVVDRSVNPIKIFPTYVFTNDYWLERKHLTVLHSYTDSIIKKRREELVKDNANVSKKRRAFLDLLLQASVDGEPLTDLEIREEVDTFMFEGHDTTASAISFALYNLSRHRDVQEKVMDEQYVIFGSDRSRPATMKELQEMTYLEMVLKESMRLYPPVAIFGRMPYQDTRYENKTLPNFCQLLVVPYAIHRNPELYPEPEKFDPDRFLPENLKGRHPYSYLTFSAGPRNCIGQRFAMLELKSSLSHILRNFKVIEVDGFEPIPIALPVLKSKNGILIKLEERD